MPTVCCLLDYHTYRLPRCVMEQFLPAFCHYYALVLLLVPHCLPTPGFLRSCGLLVVARTSAATTICTTVCGRNAPPAFLRARKAIPFAVLRLPFLHAIGTALHRFTMRCLHAHLLPPYLPPAHHCGWDVCIGTRGALHAHAPAYTRISCLFTTGWFLACTLLFLCLVLFACLHTGSVCWDTCVPTHTHYYYACSCLYYLLYTATPPLCTVLHTFSTTTVSTTTLSTNSFYFLVKYIYTLPFLHTYRFLLQLVHLPSHTTYHHHHTYFHTLPPFVY